MTYDSWKTRDDTVLDEPEEEGQDELQMVYEELHQALKGLRMRKDARADLIALLERVVEYMAERQEWQEEHDILRDAKELLNRSWDDRY